MQNIYFFKNLNLISPTFKYTGKADLMQSVKFVNISINQYMHLEKKSIKWFAK